MAANSCGKMVPVPSLSHLRKASLTDSADMKESRDLSSCAMKSSPTSQAVPPATRNRPLARASRRPAETPSGASTSSYSLANFTSASAFLLWPALAASSMELRIREDSKPATSFTRSGRSAWSSMSGQMAPSVFRHVSTFTGFMPASFSSSALAAASRSRAMRPAMRSQSLASPAAASRTWSQRRAKLSSACTFFVAPAAIAFSQDSTIRLSNTANMFNRRLLSS
mmetsp:Transcript_33806/g.105354  ORF Transcript_33806/g.105354 Transcript_33806/m.105354 type:complete len:225 (+) Transcript_33806:163-837(+)